MIEILLGMGGSLIMFVGLGLAYAAGVHSARKEQPKVVESKTEEEGKKIPVSEQFENLMRYDGRTDQ